MSSNFSQALNFENASVASEGRAKEQPSFKAQLKAIYYPANDDHLFDMATGEHLKHSTVIAAHIFQHKWQRKLSWFTNLTDINDVRNGLLLYKPVEWAFDRAKLCIETNSKGEMTFRLLDPTLHGTKLVDQACLLRDEAHRGNKPSESEKGLHVTFGDLHGQPVKFPEGVETRPSKRLLALHAIAAQLAARKMDPHDKSSDMLFDTSGDLTTLKAIKAIQITKWQADLADIDFLAVSLHHQLLDVTF
jgi:hypothetical protein